MPEPKKKAKYAPPPSFALALLIVDLGGVVRGYRSLTDMGSKVGKEGFGCKSLKGSKPTFTHFQTHFRTLAETHSKPDLKGEELVL